MGFGFEITPAHFSHNLSTPCFTGLLKGQDSAFLILGGWSGCMGSVRGEDWAAGLGLAMTIIRPANCPDPGCAVPF